MKRYIFERLIYITEVTDVVAESPEAALAEVKEWHSSDSWDRIDCDYGSPYLTYTEDAIVNA